MGGRGSSSGISDKGKKYGTEYKAVAQFGEIKVVRVKGSGSVTAPIETITKNRVYATIDKKGDIKHITFYDTYGERVKQIDVKKVENSNFDIVTDVDSTRRNKAVRLVENLLNSVSSKMPVKIELPQVAVVDFKKHSFGVDAIGGYDRTTGILYINSKYNTASKIIAYVNKQKDMFANKTEFAPLLHELGHKYYYDSIKNLAKAKNIEYNKAKKIIDDRIYDYIHERNSDGKFLLNNLSVYSNNGYLKGQYTEVIAEAFSVVENNSIADELTKLTR